MPNVTRLLDAAAAGECRAAAELLPLVSDELRKLAAAQMAGESPNHTLDATALVQEAYLRLVGDQQYEGRGHFFAAAAESKRRVLVDHARYRKRQKRGDNRQIVPIAEIPGQYDNNPLLLLTLDDALLSLSAEDTQAAEVSKLHLFTGLSIDDTATALETSRATAYRNWTYTRAWLQDAIDKNS